MLIGIKKKFIFVANSKTASTAIEFALAPYAEINHTGTPQRKHISWINVLEEYKSIFQQPGCSPQEFFKFGVIREPVEWVMSWYNYRLGNQDVEHPLRSDMTFEEFWSGADWVKNITQMEHFLDSSGSCAFDLLIPHEAIAGVFPKVLRILRLSDFSPPQKNVSRKTIRRTDISESLEIEINEHYEKDCEAYSKWRHEGAATADSFLTKIENSY